MVKLGELRIESNIPLIVLTLSVICIVVIGFLEVKKITHRINELTTEVQNVKKEKIIHEKENKDQVNKSNSMLTEENLKKQNIEIKEMLKERNNVEEQIIIQRGNDEEIVNDEGHLPSSPEEMIMNGLGFPPMMGQGGLASVILGGGPMMQMGEFHVQNMYEEDIIPKTMENTEAQFEEINEDEENDFKQSISDSDENESITVEKIIINSPREKNDEMINEENDSGEDESSEEGSESDEYSESESGSDSEEDTKLIQGKGKVEEIKEINRSLSIKELKEICQKLGLSASGNKETLIKRINNKNKI